MKLRRLSSWKVVKAGAKAEADTTKEVKVEVPTTVVLGVAHILTLHPPVQGQGQDPGPTPDQDPTPPSTQDQDQDQNRGHHQSNEEEVLPAFWIKEE